MPGGRHSCAAGAAAASRHTARRARRQPYPFATRTTAEWIQFGLEVNTPIAPAHDTKSITRDPQFQARLPLRPWQKHGTDLMPSPIKLLDEELPVPSKAAVVAGCDTDAVLAQVLGYDAERIAALRRAGALG